MSYAFSYTLGSILRYLCFLYLIRYPDIYSISVSLIAYAAVASRFVDWGLSIETRNKIISRDTLANFLSVSVLLLLIAGGITFLFMIFAGVNYIPLLIVGFVFSFFITGVASSKALVSLNPKSYFWYQNFPIVCTILSLVILEWFDIDIDLILLMFVLLLGDLIVSVVYIASNLQEMRAAWPLRQSTRNLIRLRYRRIKSYHISSSVKILYQKVDRILLVFVLSPISFLLFTNIFMVRDIASNVMGAFFTKLYNASLDEKEYSHIWLLKNISLFCAFLLILFLIANHFLLSTDIKDSMLHGLFFSVISGLLLSPFSLFLHLIQANGMFLVNTKYSLSIIFLFVFYFFMGISSLEMLISTIVVLNIIFIVIIRYLDEQKIH
jgi:hypothetical protein